MKHLFNNKFLYLIALTIIFVIAVDILSLSIPRLEPFGFYVWIFAFGLIFFFALKSAFDIFREVLKFKFVITIFTVCFFLFIVFLGFNRPTNSNFEATQEINCTLNQLEKPGKGFHKTCLFGYPTRQYYIPALPSLLFGREEINLNVGGSIYFISGFIIFAAGLIAFFKDNKEGDLISAVIIASLFHFYYVNHFIFSYEQSIFPFSFSLMLVGITLQYLKRPKNQLLLLVGIINLFLIYSYTPSLALLILSIGFLTYQLKKKRGAKSKILVVAIIAVSIFELLLSLFFRNDLHFTDNTHPPTAIISDLLGGLQHFILADYGNHFTSPFYHLVFLCLLSLPLFFIFGKKFFIITIWAWFVIIISILSKGYFYYTLDFRIHRAIIIIPVVLVVFGKILSTIKFRNKITVYILLYFFIFLTAIWYQTNYINSKVGGERHRHYVLIAWLKEKLPEKNERLLLFDNTAYQKYISFNDNLQYYFPNSKSSVTYNMCDLANYPNSDLILLTMDNNHCALNSKIDMIGVFYFLNDQPLFVYEIKK